jgi:hypothetical protein
LPYDTGDTVFLLGIALFWFWAGAFCDRNLGGADAVRPFMKKAMLLQFLLVPLGLFLLFSTVKGFTAPGAKEQLIQLNLMLIWSFALIGLPIFDALRTTRNAH